MFCDIQISLNTTRKPFTPDLYRAKGKCKCLKFEQIQFAQVLVTCKSTQSNQFTCMRDGARACTRMLDRACECSYSRAHALERKCKLALNLYHMCSTTCQFIGNCAWCKILLRENIDEFDEFPAIQFFI